MDKLIIKGIRFHGHHGVPEAERQVGGHYEVDATLGCPLINPGNTDALTDTVNYAEVVSCIVEIGTQQSFQLIEALAEKMASSNFRTIRSGCSAAHRQETASTDRTTD